MGGSIFGSSPSVVQSGPQSTTSSTQQGILGTLAALLQQGGQAAGTTEFAPTSGSSAYAAPVTGQQQSVINALAGLVGPTQNTAASVSGIAGQIPQILQQMLGYQGPQVTAPQTGPAPIAPVVSPQAATQAFQQGVVNPVTQNFLQTVVPQIRGTSAGSAGGNYSSSNAEALNQAATNLNTNLTGAGSQYALATQTANQGAQTSANALAAALQEANLGAQTSTNQLNVGSALGGQGLDVSALSQAPSAISTAFAPQFDTSSVLSSLLPGLSIPQTTAQAGIQGQASAYGGMTQQDLALLQLMEQAGTASTEQNTTVVQPGQTGLVPSLFGSLAGSQGVGNAIGAGLTSLFTSDEAAKTDIRKVGRLDKSKLPVYTYRYKTDPKQVRRMGVIAQDVEKKYPSAVVDTKPYKSVNYAELALLEAFPEAA